MQVEAIYNQGRLEFKTSIKLLGDYFAVKVELPDDQVVVEPAAEAPSPPARQVAGSSSRLLAEIRGILGSLYQEQAPAGVAEDKAAYQEALAEKYAR